MYWRYWCCCGASRPLLEQRRGVGRIALYKRSTEKYNDYILRAVGLLGYVVTFVLATHKSKYPVVLGLYSARYALVLFGLLAVSTGLLTFSVPRWRARFAQRPARTVSRRQAWVLMLASWLALPLSFMLLWSILPPHQDRPLVTAFFLMFEVLVVAGLLWWSGVGQHGFRFQRPAFWLFVLFGVQIILLALLSGKVPDYNQSGTFDEVWPIGSAWKQIHDIDAFHSLSPDRSRHTWFNFPAIWPISGIYFKLFGVGLLQGRFFYFLLAWLALPFIYQISRHYYGRSAAFASLALGIFAPIHFSRALSHVWVPTATAIALYCYIHSTRAPHGRGARISSFCCGLVAVSAVEGHIYGGAFALAFCVIHLAQLVSSLRRGNGWRGNNCRFFFAGCATFCLVWVGYHIVLPGLNLSEVVDRINKTYFWERFAIGGGAKWNPLNPNSWWQLWLKYLFIQPFEVILFLIVSINAIWRRRKGDIQLLSIWGGALLFIGFFIAHLNVHYYIFLFPMISILFGAWIMDVFGRLANKTKGNGFQLPIGASYLLITVLCLYSIQSVITANSKGAILQRELINRYVEIGQEINEILPPEEIVIAGDNAYYLGMSHRLNYWNTFSFTWGLPEYWPLDPPQAIIVTLGLDEGYSGLADWLLQYDFQAVACYPIMSELNLNEWAAILYTLPELNPSVYAQNCAPEMLAWLDN